MNCDDVFSWVLALPCKVICCYILVSPRRPVSGIGFELFSRRMSVHVKHFVPLYFKRFGSTHVFADLKHRVVNQRCCHNVFQNSQIAQINASIFDASTQQKWSCVCLAWSLNAHKLYAGHGFSNMHGVWCTLRRSLLSVEWLHTVVAMFVETQTQENGDVEFDPANDQNLIQFLKFHSKDLDDVWKMLWKVAWTSRQQELAAKTRKCSTLPQK